MKVGNDPLKTFYESFSDKVDEARARIQHPLTLTEKILYSHLYSTTPVEEYKRGKEYGCFKPDRVAMQDATAQMAVLQFMNAGKERVEVPTTIHCDHLVQAKEGAVKDLERAERENEEVYQFLKSASSRYGIGFWKPGAGIIHQVVLENYAFPGGMMVGTDSHTPNAGGLGMMAIGVGGADAVDVMTGMEWELKVPRIIGVRLKGSLKGWTSPKDVILELAGIMTVKGGTNSVIEYFGEGTESISCTGRATICNMGAELGATTSIFPYDTETGKYLAATGRAGIAVMAARIEKNLKPDLEVLEHPGQYYDEVIDIDLDTLEPHINGPFTPDAACQVSRMKERVTQKGYPENVEVCLIGSCTNSSYQDLKRASEVVAEALRAGLKPKAQLIINPGSEKIRTTAERDGILKIFEDAGAIIMANACGPCIGQWHRLTDDPLRKNTIVTTFNRNFAKRADGNPNTHAFIASPEMAAAIAFSGKLFFNPLTDKIGVFQFSSPSEADLPKEGFTDFINGYSEPAVDAELPVIKENSRRIQRLEPFKPWDGKDMEGLNLLIKVKGKCTTDHISMAGPWLKYRGHLENISENLLMGAVNAFNGKTDEVRNKLDGNYCKVSEYARCLKANGKGSIVVAEENYGEGSSREHAAMEPRFLGVRVILAKSYARIHETNLKKQGILALTFENQNDYDIIREDDEFKVSASEIRPGEKIKVDILHSDGTRDSFYALHTYNGQQLGWLKAGSALNSLKY